MPDHDFDQRVRLATYHALLTAGSVPTPDTLAPGLGVDPATVRQAWERLDASHQLVLRPDSRALWMAMPLSAVPTGFRVHSARGSWWANCAWDALGVAAMLDLPARIEAACGDCEEQLVVEVGDAGPRSNAVAHFALPARRWWDDIGYT